MAIFPPRRCSLICRPPVVHSRNARRTAAPQRCARRPRAPPPGTHDGSPHPTRATRGRHRQHAPDTKRWRCRATGALHHHRFGHTRQSDGDVGPLAHYIAIARLSECVLTRSCIVSGMAKQEHRASPLTRVDRREAIVTAVLPLVAARGTAVTSRELSEAAGV